MTTVERGDIVLTDLSPVEGSEQGRTRPTLVIQNDVGNRHAPTTIVAPLTSSYDDVYPTDVEVAPEATGLDRPSKVLLNQITTIDMEARILEKLGALDADAMQRVDRAIEISLGLD